MVNLVEGLLFRCPSSSIFIVWTRNFEGSSINHRNLYVFHYLVLTISFVEILLKYLSNQSNWNITRLKNVMDHREEILLISLTVSNSLRKIKCNANGLPVDLKKNWHFFLLRHILQMNPSSDVKSIMYIMYNILIT